MVEMRNRARLAAALLFLAPPALLGEAGCARRTEGARAPAAGIETPLGGPGGSAAAPGDGDDGARSAGGGRAEVQVGYATWYGKGRRTADGERFDPTQMTAAHRTLPFGTWVEVKRLDTGQSVRVRINDRGPFGHDDRIIDLARAAAAKIGLVKAGMTRVEVRIVDGPGS
jgi:rare lipoprotein A